MFERDEYENASLYAAGILCEEEASEPFAPIKRKETTDRKSEVKKVLEMLYDTQGEGYIAVLIKDATTEECKQRYIPLREAAEKIADMQVETDKSIYLGRNPFSCRSSKKYNLQALSNIGLDIDCHKEAVTRQDCEILVKTLKSELNMSWCTVVSYTGHGIHLWWHINALDSKKYSFVYHKIVTELILRVQKILAAHEDLQKFKVDSGASKEEAGMLRLFGSYNPSAGVYVDFEINGTIYDLKDLGDADTGDISEFERQNIKKTKKKQYSAKQTISSFANQAEKRLRTFCGLLSERNAWGEGCRHNFLFVYHATALVVYDKQEARQMTEEINKGFRPAITDLNCIIRYNEKNRPRFTNAFLIEYLDMTELEQDLFSFYISGTGISYIQTQEDKEEQARKRADKEHRNQKIVTLYQQGFVYEDIAKETGCTVGTVCNRVNKCSKAEKTCHNVQILKSKGLTQKTVSEKLKVSVATTQKYWNLKGLDKI